MDHLKLKLTFETPCILKKWYGFQSDVLTIQQVTEDLAIDNNTWRLGHPCGDLSTCM